MMSVRFPRLAAVPVYLIVSVIGSAAFSMYAFIASVYRIVEVGLDPLELVLVGTVLEVAVFFFEVPTGVVADVYGRRLSLVISSTLVGAAFIVEGLVPMFLAVLLAQVLFGVGATFRSGALQAWVADELDNKGVGRLYLRGSQASRIGAIAGIGIGVSVSSSYVNLPVSEAGGAAGPGRARYHAAGAVHSGGDAGRWFPPSPQERTRVLEDDDGHLRSRDATRTATPRAPGDTGHGPLLWSIQ